jgi:hypothetical protein
MQENSSLFLKKQNFSLNFDFFHLNIALLGFSRAKHPIELFKSISLINFGCAVFFFKFCRAQETLNLQLGDLIEFFWFCA